MEVITFKDIIPHLKSDSIYFQAKLDALIHGLHNSIRKGYEDNFIEYRKYERGDDLRFLDWRLYAKKEKLFIRQGMQKSRQRIFIWLDTSLSQRYSALKYNTAWLLALSLAYLLKQNNDKVFLYLEGLQNIKSVIEIKSLAEIIELEKIMMSSLKSKKYIQENHTSILNIAQQNLKRKNKIIWITDLYIPIDEFEDIVNRINKNEWSLSLIHLTEEDEWKQKNIKKDFLTRVIDVETKEWLSASKLKNYPQIWEKAIKKRIELLSARNFLYFKGQIEDGPIKILGSLIKH